MDRVVVCFTGRDGVEVRTFTVDFVFGPFNNHIKALDFMDKHEKICKRLHAVRKLNDPKVGVK